MPIYEYRCRSCGRKSSFLTLSVKTPVEAVCRACGSRDMEKLVSRVSIALSEESRLERLSDPSSFSGLDENDPKSMARWMKKMGKEMGEDLGDDFDQSVDEALEEENRGGAGGEDSGAGGLDGDL